MFFNKWTGKKIFYLLLILFFFWIILSLYWYNCQLKDFCKTNEKREEINKTEKNNTIIKKKIVVKCKPYLKKEIYFGKKSEEAVKLEKILSEMGLKTNNNGIYDEVEMKTINKIISKKDKNINLNKENIKKINEKYCYYKAKKIN